MISCLSNEMNYKGIINKQAPDYFSSNISNNYLNPSKSYGKDQDRYV